MSDVSVTGSTGHRPPAVWEGSTLQQVTSEVLRLAEQRACLAALLSATPIISLSFWKDLGGVTVRRGHELTLSLPPTVTHQEPPGTAGL